MVHGQAPPKRAWESSQGPAGPPQGLASSAYKAADSCMAAGARVIRTAGRCDEDSEANRGWGVEREVILAGKCYATSSISRCRTRTWREDAVGDWGTGGDSRRCRAVPSECRAAWASLPVSPCHSNCGCVPCALGYRCGGGRVRVSSSLTPSPSMHHGEAGGGRCVSGVMCDVTTRASRD